MLRNSNCILFWSIILFIHCFSVGSVLSTSTLMWKNSMDNLTMYIKHHIPVDSMFTSTLLGIQLAEDLELGKKSVT